MKKLMALILLSASIPTIAADESIEIPDPNAKYYQCMQEQTGMPKPERNEVNANVHYEVARRKAMEYCQKCGGIIIQRSENGSEMPQKQQDMHNLD